MKTYDAQVAESKSREPIEETKQQPAPPPSLAGLQVIVIGMVLGIAVLDVVFSTRSEAETESTVEHRPRYNTPARICWETSTTEHSLTEYQRRYAGDRSHNQAQYKRDMNALLDQPTPERGREGLEIERTRLRYPLGR
jgi:hypothetical protein